MTRVVKDALRTLEDVLMRGDKDAKDLWAILTALRGPDSGDGLLKLRTTVHIRKDAFPRIALEGTSIPASFQTFDERASVEELYKTSKVATHFTSHFSEACKALERQS